MKIAFITRHYNKTGGISRYVAELAERFALDNEVHIFTSSCADVENDKIIFHKIPILSFNFLKKKKKFAWNNIFEVASFILKSHNKINHTYFDIVHTQGDYVGEYDVYTAHSCHKTWLKIALSNNCLRNYLTKSVFNPLHFFILLNEKYYFKNNTSNKIVISVSKGVKREIVENYNYPAEKIVVIPNGVDIQEFNPEKKEICRGLIQKKHNLGDDDFIILFTAKQFERKGLKFIIESLPFIKSEKVKLVVLGGDNFQPYLRLATKLNVERKVIFVGHYSKVHEYYPGSDLFVFPTQYEAFSLATLEAAASGLPLLTTKVNGTEELVKDGINGFFINRSAEDIAQKINILLENRKLLNEMGVQARKTAENYSWDIIAKKTFEVYKEIYDYKRRKVV